MKHVITAQLVKWVDEPFLETALVGCLVRVAYKGAYSVGEVAEVVTREPGVYRDTGVRTPSPYTLASGKETDRWLRLARGGHACTFPLTVVSNHGMSEKEFASWRECLAKDGDPPPSRQALREAEGRLQACASYVYTDGDVRRMVEAKRAARGAANPVAERARLEALRDAAAQEGRQEEGR